MEKLLLRLNSFLEKHGNRISIGICVVAALAVAGILYQRSVKAKEQGAWAQLAVSSGNVEDLGDVWAKHPDTSAAPWARLLEAEQRLSAGVKSMFLDLEAGKKDVEKARNSFEKLAEQTSVPNEVRERALFGLGRAEESLSEGETQDAVKAYSRLLEKFPNSYYKDDVKQRLEALKKGGSAEFYQWFAKFERPKTKDRSPHDTGMGGGMSDDALNEAIRRITERDATEGAAGKGADDDDPTESDDEPKSKGGLTPPAEEGTESDKVPEATESTEASGDSGKPAADDVPSTPAEEKPATETPAEPDSEAKPENQ